MKTFGMNRLKTRYFHYMANYHLRKANKAGDGSNNYYSNRKYWYYFNKSMNVNG